MLTRIAGGEIIDPGQRPLGHGRPLDPRWTHRRRLRRAARPTGPSTLTDCIVMAGAIDIHSHIGGGNVNTARLLLARAARRA